MIGRVDGRTVEEAGVVIAPHQLRRPAGGVDPNADQLVVRTKKSAGGDWVARIGVGVDLGEANEQANGREQPHGRRVEAEPGCVPIVDGALPGGCAIRCVDGQPPDAAQHFQPLGGVGAAERGLEQVGVFDGADFLLCHVQQHQFGYRQRAGDVDV